MTYPVSIPELTLETSPAMAQAYAALTYDYNPLHLDREFAATTPFGSPIAHGTMALNLLIEAIDRSMADSDMMPHLDIRFSAPVKVGETIRTGGNRLSLTGNEYEVWVATLSGTHVLSGRLVLMGGEGERS